MSLLPGFCIAMVSAGGDEEAETTAWVAAVVGDGGSVSAGRQTLVNDLIVGLKADGIWDKLDRLWLFAAENQQSALRDIVGANQATAVGSPTFTTDEGYTGAAAKAIDTNFDPSVGSPNFIQNSASMGAWSLSSGQNAGVICGIPTHTYIYPRFTDDVNYWRITSADVTQANTDATGFWFGSRTGSNTLDLYLNGSSFDTSATASISVGSSEAGFLGYATTAEPYIGGRCACGIIGGGLNATEAGNLYTRLQTYMTAVGL